MRVNNTAKAERLNENFSEFLRNPKVLKENIQELVEQEKHVFGSRAAQLKELAEYIRADWKVIVPTLTALGITLLLMKPSDRAKSFMRH